MKKLLPIVFIVLIMFLISSNVNAAIIFSNYGESDTHSTTTGYGIVKDYMINGDTFVSDWDMGMTFVPFGNDFTFDTLEVSVSLYAGTNEIDLWLMTDNNFEPGSIIESFHLSNQMQNWAFSQQVSPLLVNSISNPLLESGERYWIVLSASERGSSIHWHGNAIEQIGPRALYNGFYWDVATLSYVKPAAFRVTGSPVPVPGTILLIGSGIIGLVGIRRKLIP